MTLGSDGVDGLPFLFFKGSIRDPVNSKVAFVSAKLEDHARLEALLS